MKVLLNIFLFASFGILITGVMRLSVVRGAYYKSLARDNKVLETKIPAARGEIVDRKGRTIAKSVYQYFKKVNDTKVFEGSGDFQGNKFEGKDLAMDLKRQYIYGESLGLLTGYVGKPKSSEIDSSEICGYKIDKNDLIGRSGLEEYFNCKLAGIDGMRLVEVDAMGNYVRELGRNEPVSGEKLRLSIDAYWQDVAYKLLDKKKGVVIVTEPQTGKILVLASSPSIDPNVFSYEQDNRIINEYLNDNEGLPMLNRTVAAKYHSGSVFKPVVAAAGLEEKVIDKNTLIEDTGVIKIGDYSFNNWLWTKKGGTDGMVDIVKALQRSNDIYFYRLGERLGVDRIKTWALNFGYGNKTGVELPGEIPGLVPDDKWKQQTKGERWFLGNTYHLSIGQGDLAVTPLQVNLMTNIVANRGIKCLPTLLNDKKSECRKIGIELETVTTIIEGMRRACQSGGTAYPLFNFKVAIACKTGTAEVGDGSKDTHAWLTAFAPIDNPEISITVMIERGGEGSDAAAPIVGDFLKEYFNEPETVVVKPLTK